MRSSVPYSLAFVGLVFTATLVVLGQADENCRLISDCKTCVTTKSNVTVTNTTDGGSNGTCIWEETGTGPQCVELFRPSEATSGVVFNEISCKDGPSTTTPPPSTTTAPPAPTTNGTTTAPPTTTNGTTTTPPSTTTTAAPSTNGTTTTPPSTTTTATPTTNGTTTVAPPTNGTTPATPTTAAPASSTTPSPKPAPSKGGFSWGSFLGGIIFAAALSSLGYLIFRFYKVRLDRNYHTLSTNLI